MKFFVTGVAGFLGSHIAERLIFENHEVVGVDNLIGGYIENVPDRVDFHNFDLANLDSLNSGIMKNVDVVVHSACTAYEGLSVFSPNLIVQNTMQITASMLSASVKAEVPKFIYLSSMARYGEQEIVPFTENMIPKPQDPYGIAKYASELLVQNLAKSHNFDFSILVPHNIIGPRQKYDDPYRNVASIMINRMLKGLQPVIYGDGEQKRCFSFIQDVISPLMKVCLSDVGNSRIINIGPDEEFVSINELAKIIAKILNFDLNPLYFPGRPGEVINANCSADLARKILMYKTSTTLESGLQELVEWIKEMGPKEFDYNLPIEFIRPDTPRTWVDKLM
jgi:UDP-glucose 4-epimerase